MSATTKNIKVRYDANASPKFSYEPTIRTNPADGRRVVAELAGKKNGHEDYILVFTLKGAEWPATNWIEFPQGTPPPFNGATAPNLKQNQRFITIKNGLGVSQAAAVFGFKLNVVTDSGTDQSPDPDIVLDPPKP